ncbi:MULTISPECIES: lantibiotic dehydratase C-terminal domain-containing protein [Streptomyces]|uniref:lantibiotic dehydratase C-terminal domain-containing protein n=1 Tax=Streptomyces TaxID=1883 RepID=UPI001C2F6E81|nr:lantibiotic dehydratase C-terminal domain-containing protein [Streptomyces sp. GbtcB7]
MTLQEPTTTAPFTPPAWGCAEPGEGKWQALYIFYTGNPRPVLTEYVKPLVDGLTADGLLARYFFLNYWLEGPHIRLRLKPSTPGHTAEVRRRAEEELRAFLRARPSLYEVRSDFYVGLYNTLFDLEFTPEERLPYLGEDGTMRLRNNNSFSWEPYEPEYGKYGGPAGVELAEWHFKHSSDLVIDAARTMNLHVRTVLLGTAAQLMMVMSSTFLGERPAMAAFLERYHSFWHNAFADTALISGTAYDGNYDTMAESVRKRFTAIHGALTEQEPGRLSGFVRAWAEHCAELRHRARELAVRGDLVFRSWDGTRDEAVTDPDVAAEALLSPYMHMTNNRLHVTVTDEAYLSHVLARSLRESCAVEAG